MKTSVNLFDGRLHGWCDDVPTKGQEIPQLDEDPSGPLIPGRAWILRVNMSQGTPLGLLLALTFGIAVPPKYLLSYSTIDNGIIRVELTEGGHYV